MKGNAILHCFKYFIGIDHPETQTSESEQISMRKYTKTAKSIVEIGVFEGYNTLEFAKFSDSKCIIYAIDPFFKGILGFCYGKLIAMTEWKKREVSKKIQIIEGLSWDVTDLIPDQIDFVFIDGDHSFKGVSQDFELYSKKLSDNGVIALHDARLFPNGWTKAEWGPVKFVEEIIKSSGEWLIIEEVDSIVYLQKAKV